MSKLKVTAFYYYTKYIYLIGKIKVEVNCKRAGWEILVW